LGGQWGIGRPARLPSPNHRKKLRRERLCAAKFDHKGLFMELRSEEMPNGVKLVTLAGRFDIAGTQEIDQRFTALTASSKALIAVDVSAVSFLASIGIRTLVSSARALANRGGAMALVGPQPLVEQTLLAAGIDSIIPIFPNLDEAGRGLQASATAH
jgi:anti-sigma B factor antagonist